MYSIIDNIINHAWETSNSAQQYIYCICGSMIIILTVTFIDMIYRIFRGFWGR